SPLPSTGGASAPRAERSARTRTRGRHKIRPRLRPYRHRMSARKTFASLAHVLLACHGAAETGSALDRAQRAAGNGEYKKAAELFASAAASESDPERREDAVLHLANIEWRGFRDHAAARARLQKLDMPRAHVELARLAMDLGDFAAARAEAT